MKTFAWWLLVALLLNASILLNRRMCLTQMWLCWVAVCLCLLASAGQAATLTWTNESPGHWDQAGNWSPNQVPGPGDDAMIPVGSPSITVDVSVLCSDLELYGGNLQVYTNLVVSDSLALSGGALDIYGGGVMVNEGDAEWTAGNMAMQNGAVLSNAVTGTFTISGAVSTSDSYVGQDPEPVVANSGTLVVNTGTNRASIEFIGFNNTGSLEVLSGTLWLLPRTSFNTGNSFIAAGATIDMASGGGTYNFEDGAILWGQGNFQMDNSEGGPAAVVFSASYTVTNGLWTINAGTVTFNGDGSIMLPNVDFNGGNLEGSNLVTLTGTMNWSGGAIVGTVLSEGTMTLGFGGNQWALSGILTNAGTIEVTTGSQLLLSGNGSTGGLLVNLPGGLMDEQANNLLNSSGSTLIVNQGTFRKSAGGNTLDIAPVFENYGTLDVQSGGVALQGGGFGSTNATFLPEAGTTLLFNSSYTVNSSLIGPGTNLLSTSGTVTLNGNINGSNVVLALGNLLATNCVINGGLLWTRGQPISGSVMTVASNALFTMSFGGGQYSYEGILTNAGTIEVTTGSQLLLSGNGSTGGLLVNLPGGLMDEQANNLLNSSGSTLIVNQGTFRKSTGANTLDIAPEFENFGTLEVEAGEVSLAGGYQLSAGVLNLGLNSLTNYGVVNLPGSATLAGTISANLNGGYIPPNGTTFAVVTYNSRAGLFTNTVLPPGFTWTTNYGATQFTLTVASNLPGRLATNLNVKMEGGQAVLQFGGASNTSYTILASTNVAASTTNWTALGQASQESNGMFQFSDDQSPGYLQRFYRVRSP